MSRLEDWCEDRRERFSRLYMRLAWVCFVILLFFGYDPAGVGVFGFSTASVVLYHYRPTDEEHLRGCTSQADSSSSSCSSS